MQYSINYSGTKFLSTEIKITQFLGGFRLNSTCPVKSNTCYT